MNELKKFLKDPVFLLPLAFFLLFEMFLQSGMYKIFLQPRSYADNVNRIVRITRSSDVNPRILILGTSVAYQGIQVPLLNEKLSENSQTADLQVQSGATEGAMLETQHMIFRAIHGSMPELETIIHVADPNFAWNARYDLEIANRSMLAQFPRRDAFDILDQHEYRLSRSDISYFMLGVLTYQMDLRNFILDPAGRIKSLSRRWRDADYVYINEQEFSIADFYEDSLEQCIETARQGIPETQDGRQVTDRHHSNAVLQTCLMARNDPVNTPGAGQWNDLFFRRLAKFHNEMRSEGYRIITVFAPYSDIVQHLNSDDRIDLWHQHLAKIQGDDIDIWDLRDSLGERNGHFFYDTIHMNRKGAEAFSEVLYQKITEELQERSNPNFEQDR